MLGVRLFNITLPYKCVYNTFSKCDTQTKFVALQGPVITVKTSTYAASGYYYFNVNLDTGAILNSKYYSDFVSNVAEFFTLNSTTVFTWWKINSVTALGTVDLSSLNNSIPVLTPTIDIVYPLGSVQVSSDSLYICASYVH